MKEEKKSISLSLDSIRKSYGEGAIMRLGDQPKKEWDVIPTGCPTLDSALGIGGFPKGRFIEVYGNESAGKSTLALHTVANAQKLGGLVAYVDTEYALDVEYAKALGVDTDNLLVAQPSSAEEALEIVEELVRSEQLSLIVVDSIAAMVSQTEINGEFGDANMGIMARLMGQACRKLTSITAQNNTCILWINQLRATMATGYGPQSTTPGGKAMKFYASMRLDISKIQQIKQGEEVIGNRTKVKIVKNKCAPPFKNCEFDIMFGTGISIEGDVIDLALKAGVLVQKGSWFKYGEESIAQGKEGVRKLFKGSPELMAEIQGKINETRN